MPPQRRTKIWIGPVLLNLRERTLTYNGQVGDLEPRHCDLLETLALAADSGNTWEVVAPEELLRSEGLSGAKRTAKIRQIVSEIRKIVRQIGAKRIFVIKSRSKFGYQIRLTLADQHDEMSSGGAASTLGGSADSQVDLTAPTEEASEFAAQFNAGIYRKVGCCIETFGHFNLSSGLPIDKIGWSPSNITISLDRRSFDARAILGDPKIAAAFKASEEERRRKALGTALQEPNGTKFAIVNVSSPFCDTTDITVTMQQTTYFDILRARPGIDNDPDARIKYGHVIPSKSRIPQAAGIQFAVLFADARILTIKRAEDTFPWPGTWSFSGEEQIASVDMTWDEGERMKRTLLRTAVEEVFPLARIDDRRTLIEVMDVVEPHLISMRTWSLFIEELTGILHFFTVFHLSLTSGEYVDVAQKLVQRGKGKPSYEGLYYTIPHSCIESLLHGEVVLADPLFGHSQLECNPNDLHPTSRYRLLSLRDYGVRANTSV